MHLGIGDLNQSSGTGSLLREELSLVVGGTNHRAASGRRCNMWCSLEVYSCTWSTTAGSGALPSIMVPLY